MNYFTKHLKDAKIASGKPGPVTVRDYTMHCIVSMREARFLMHAAFASVVHALFPWLYGFELIQWQIDMLKRLKTAIPDLEVWNQIEFKDDDSKD